MTKKKTGKLSDNALDINARFLRDVADKMLHHRRFIVRLRLALVAEGEAEWARIIKKHGGGVATSASSKVANRAIRLSDAAELLSGFRSDAYEAANLRAAARLMAARKKRVK
jgi:hypothetical protein